MTKIKNNCDDKTETMELHAGEEHILPQQPDLTHEVLGIAGRASSEFFGLAPFLRMSIAGGDIYQLGHLLLDEALRDQNNACLLMNTSTALYAQQMDTLADSVQQQALILQRTYVLPSSSQPVKFRLLMLMVPGNLGENIPLDCLLEGSPVELVYHYISQDEPLPTPLPEHDAVMVAFSDSATNRPLLERLAVLLQDWHRPVINQPRHVPNTERHRASELLQGVPELMMPSTHEVARTLLESVACGEIPATGLFAGYEFPIIVRPVCSHGGHGLERIADVQALTRYLKEVNAERYYVSPFIDYSSPDGQFRKFRVALVNGQPFASHMAISSHWMVHYLNAGMYEDAAKRSEEQVFMEHFNEFARRHEGALRAIYERAALDYLCIDCAETRDGQLLIFEIDPLMVVHAMDPVDLFPHKQIHMAKLRRAFEEYLLGLRRH